MSNEFNDAFFGGSGNDCKEHRKTNCDPCNLIWLLLSLLSCVCRCHNEKR